MPGNNNSTTELTFESLVSTSISEKKKEIRDLKKSLKQEQDRTAELRTKVTDIESENRVLRYRVKNTQIVKIFEVIFSAIFGLGLGMIFIDNIDLIYKVSTILIGLIGVILVQFVNGKE